MQRRSQHHSLVAHAERVHASSYSMLAGHCVQRHGWRCLQKQQQQQQQQQSSPPTPPPRPTSTCLSLLSLTPWPALQLVEWACCEMQGSFQGSGSGLPPWRSLDQVLK